ncbi:hypothetical protein [Phenylobacterium sp.]|jgi:hypothetical protein|uniref:hypothetical protein n=1 Tax=Phenylobacterium sp. TaxID=1871053 RepID=UPI002F41E438
MGRLGIDRERPLFIVDVDEVLGLFMASFGVFLQGHGLELRLDRYALFQNIYAPGAAEHLDLAEGRRLFDEFFRRGCADMEPAPGAAEALRRISRQATVVVLSNAPAPARLGRARWLGRHGLDYPLMLSSGPKGPPAAAMAARTTRRCAFVDDLVSNLDSVAEADPGVARFQHVADVRLQPLAPAAPDRHRRIDDWTELGEAVAASLAER